MKKHWITVAFFAIIFFSIVGRKEVHHQERYLPDKVINIHHFSISGSTVQNYKAFNTFAEYE
ncbi:MAG TPA: hypothetical protein VNG53_10310 [Bacteroidia bacterium]|nr:hypothetical protein [Bacteroidia bacterium]